MRVLDLSSFMTIDCPQYCMRIDQKMDIRRHKIVMRTYGMEVGRRDSKAPEFGGEQIRSEGKRNGKSR